MSRPPVLWSPPPELAEGSRMAAYRAWLRDTRGLELDGPEALHAWSVTDLEGFWSSVWEFFDLRSSADPGPVLAVEAMPGAVWFPGARLNYAEHALRHDGGAAPALVQAGEEGLERTLSWDELRGQVGSVAQALRGRGVGEGDVVCAYLPNCAEAVIGFLACAAVGATWASCAPELEPAAAMDRFGQLAPKLLLLADGYRFGGRVRDRREAAVELARRLGTPDVVAVAHVGVGAHEGLDATPWSALTAAPREPEFAQLPFDHPLYVLFSSGTTGAPKGIVHGHGGQLLDHVRHHALHLDLGPGDRFCWYTTTSWMVWNWLVAGLLVGATVVVYDGSPRHPGLDAQFALAEAAEVTVLGSSASYLTACAKAGLQPGRDRDLRALRTVASTASPLPPGTFRWIHDAVGPGTWIVSASGGTDVCSAFVSGSPERPVRPGEIQCRCLGAAVEVFDEAGRPVVGEVGELVMTRPLPSMPVRFWDDEDGSRYHDAYFSTFEGVWRHGDWAVVHEDGACTILGRSDSTLNRHGVRIGTAEIYAAVDTIDGIADSMVLGLEQPDGGYWMPLFVELDAGVALDDALVQRIRETIRASTSPRHVPDTVHQVPAIPRTRTAKKLEVPIKRLLMGTPPEQAIDVGAVADPDALEPFLELARERARASS